MTDDLRDLPPAILQGMEDLVKEAEQAGFERGKQAGLKTGHVNGYKAALDEMEFRIGKLREELAPLDETVTVPQTAAKAPLETPLEELGLSTRVLNRLYNAGVNSDLKLPLQSIGDVYLYAVRYSLGDIPRFGVGSWQELNTALKAVGYDDLPPH